MQELWDKDFMPREQRQELQLQRLRNTVALARQRVPFYAKAMDEKGVTEADLKSLADIKLLPFTIKTDLRDNYPFGLFAVPREELARVHASSGTTGKSTVVGYTSRDLETWTDLVARSLHVAGVRPGDTLRFGIASGANQFFGFLEALRQYNMVKVLANPTLVTTSGRPASFKVGGEFPILVPAGLGTISIEYKPFGTRVDFVPIVLGNGNLRLEVRPQVSEIDEARKGVEHLKKRFQNYGPGETHGIPYRCLTPKGIDNRFFYLD